MTDTKSRADSYQLAIDPLSLIDEDWARLIKLILVSVAHSLVARLQEEKIMESVAAVFWTKEQDAV
ncbi:hypothetical protein [Nitrosospira sp. NpAV]|uniref:hypothetical protein n=1 Tax=Nitrosospira sp. NpAV TaxID=58133 RepID=UPI00059FF190|nr:hypothetical protein [Nitrosospira sp. NpAV]KIO47930.1 hypothetical protein SQ11_14555 [Nitrosospira sp. NpAV]